MLAIAASRSVAVDRGSSRAKDPLSVATGTVSPLSLFWKCVSRCERHAANGCREWWGVGWVLRGGANGRTSVWVIPNKLLLEGWYPGIMAANRQCPVGHTAAYSRITDSIAAKRGPVKGNLRLQLTVDDEMARMDKRGKYALAIMQEWQTWHWCQNDTETR